MKPAQVESGSNTVVTFGEVMLRLSTPGNQRFVQSDCFDASYAGAEANVAVSLKLMGIPSRHITRFPLSDLGQAATNALARYGVDTSCIVYGDERMGLYFLENGSMQRSSRIIYDRFDSAFSNIRSGEIDWDSALKGAGWFHYTGITPAISQGAADECLKAVSIARKNGVLISGDINYRRNLWQYGKSATDIMPSLIEHTDFVVAGIADIENCCDISGKTFEESCKALMKKFPAVKKVASTDRTTISSSHNKVSAQMWNGKQLLKSREYELTHIVDRVGAGDAFMAGLIYGALTGKSDQGTLDFGVAAGAMKHSIPGDANLVTAREIEQLVEGENIGKLLR